MPVTRVSTADPKPAGFDITVGRVTMPVIMAVGMLPEPDLRALWSSISSKPVDQRVIKDVVEQLHSSGATRRCEELAADLVDESFAILDLALPNSLQKMIFKSVAQLVCGRT